MTSRLNDQDTIVALATPEGHAALGVVRLSGPDAWDIAGKALRDPSRVAAFEPRKAVLVDLADSKGEPIDQVVILPWKNPASYTGEDLIEFSCHGGRETLRLVVQRLRDLGARPAEPGEFTRRAFLNGKMTLEQAEAVAALIDARTASSAKAAVRVLEGGLGNRIRSLQEALAEFLSKIEIGLDFVEEEIKTYEPDELIRFLSDLEQQLSTLLQQHRAGHLLRHGALVVIAGPPNAGKSTLLNRILGYDRAIVSDMPGTTRDYLDVTIDLEGIPLQLVDTAGLREASDAIEQEGTQRAHSLLDRADRILWLLAPPTFEPPPSSLQKDERLTLLVNKSDLGNLPAELTSLPQISGRTGKGVDEMLHRLVDDLLQGADPSELLILEERHADRISDAVAAVGRTSDLVQQHASEELLATELRDAVNALGEITGTITTDDLLNRIFSRFCIGK